MKRILTTSLFVAAMGHALPVFAEVDFHPVPLVAETTAGGALFTGPLSNSARSIQFLINENQLVALDGQELSGLTFRLPAALNTTWPVSAVTFDSFDIYLGGSVAPASRSLTFADNRVGAQTLVRSGSLVIDAASFTSDATPADWGVVIDFTEWTYTGGHLLVEIRHTGFTGTGRSVDAVAATNTAAGYGTDFSALWVGSYTPTTGLQGNFSVLALTSSAVPEPSSYAMLAGLGVLAAGLGRRRRR